eukprot:scaffold14971_cov121-Skeletonema_dohrnii-CCMP3373.AAC.2
MHLPTLAKGSSHSLPAPTLLLLPPYLAFAYCFSPCLIRIIYLPSLPPLVHTYVDISRQLQKVRIANVATDDVITTAVKILHFFAKRGQVG